MPRSPLRARVAPVAFLIVLAFVVIGFFKADSEMVHGERDRATATASESAARLEAFLFRHEAWLRSAQASSYPARRHDGGMNAAAPTKHGKIGVAFDAVWVLDSTNTVRDIIITHGSTTGPHVGTPLFELVPSIVGRQLAVALQQTGGGSSLVEAQTLPLRRLYFAVPAVVGTAPALVGFVSIDSLTETLRVRQTILPLSWVLSSGNDTIVRVSNDRLPVRAKSVETRVNTPFGTAWTLTMVYSPSGRGVRIALWIVGLGAVLGLGIGLLLERREATRIADRSSELEHLSTELLRANRAKSEFLANVSHELRTPLNAIVGFVDLLRDGVYGTLNARQVGPVERIEASANHLRHLVDQVLDLAKMAAGRLEVHTEPVELRPFVFDVASEVEPLITEKGLNFSLTVGATLPRVRTDPTHLRQILINLLGNAVKFTSTGGIAIRGKLVGSEPRPVLPSVLTAATSLLMRSPRPDGLWIALQVVDSGIGIAEKDRDRIFEEFEQVNAGPRGDSMRRGTGLGLSISRRLARLIGGDISVESELGRGSVFTVWLPVDPADLRGDQAA